MTGSKKPTTPAASTKAEGDKLHYTELDKNASPKEMFEAIQAMVAEANAKKGVGKTDKKK